MIHIAAAATLLILVAAPSYNPGTGTSYDRQCLSYVDLDIDACGNDADTRRTFQQIEDETRQMELLNAREEGDE